MLYEAREDVKLEVLLKDMDAELNEDAKDAGPTNDNNSNESGNLPYTDYVLRNHEYLRLYSTLKGYL